MESVPSAWELYSLTRASSSSLSVRRDHAVEDADDEDIE